MAASSPSLTAEAILAEIKPQGAENYRRIMLKHGAAEPIYGVKIEYLKKIQKRVKKDYQLALDLWDTGVYDARYLAGLIADDEQMTKRDLKRWVDQACEPLVGYTVAAVAAGSHHGWELALDWIDSKKELTASAGWATLGALVSIKPDSELDLDALKKLLLRVQKEIHTAPDMVRYKMNGFVISVGSYVGPLTKLCKETGGKIGPVTVDMGDTECQVPFIVDYIAKVEKRGTIGKKRATAKC
jgi:3-methyladenine DNA glycosylase AlkD